MLEYNRTKKLFQGRGGRLVTLKTDIQRGARWTGERKLLRNVYSQFHVISFFIVSSLVVVPVDIVLPILSELT